MWDTTLTSVLTTYIYIYIYIKNLLENNLKKVNKNPLRGAATTGHSHLGTG